MNKPDFQNFPELALETTSDADTLRYFTRLPVAGDVFELRCTGVEQTDKGARYTFKYFPIL